MAPPTKPKPKRNCLICGKAFELKSNGPSHADKKYCSHNCSSIGQRKYVDRTFKVACEQCGKETFISGQANYRRRIRNNTRVCNGCSRKGQKRTEEQRALIAKKTNEAMTDPAVWDKFMQSMRSDGHRELQRINFAKQMVQKGSGVLYNKRACKFFKLLNEQLGWNGLYAENGGEQCVGGFWTDYYEPTLNLVIEWDEPHHKYPKKVKQDKYRAKYIMKKLGCRFLRIDQDTLNVTEVIV